MEIRDDLISRAAAVRIIADMHGLCRDDVLRESIQAIKELPTIDAIPVEWLEAHAYNIAVKGTLAIWKKEQEVQYD